MNVEREAFAKFGPELFTRYQPERRSQWPARLLRTLNAGGDPFGICRLLGGDLFSQRFIPNLSSTLALLFYRREASRAIGDP